MELGRLRRKFGKFILIVVATFFLGWGAYHAGKWIFTIRSIEIVGEGIHIAIDEKRLSTNLLFFPSETFRQQILSDNPLLADIQFEKKFPGTLRIIPIIRTPIAILVSGDRIVLLDNVGMVLSDGSQGKTLPHIIISVGPIRVGGKIEDDRVKRAVAIITRLGSEIAISRISYEDGGFLRANADKLDIFIPQEGSLDEMLTTLQTLLTGFRIKGTLPAVVDLRFDKPIVTF